ncbi:MAG: hypothetical protein VX822_06125 [Candidatus Neomarinimicrobiota bacterium]|nr:hypothetical protein [Candidatus Neomarinimicrobiota bacterium]
MSFWPATVSAAQVTGARMKSVKDGVYSAEKVCEEVELLLHNE